MTGVVELSGDAVVLRFRPVAPTTVLKGMEREFRRVEHYGTSVFAVVPQDATAAGVALAVEHLLRVAALLNIQADPRYFVCERAKNLLDEGFAFSKDGDVDELPEHYCVILGSRLDQAPTLQQVETYLERFDERRLVR